MHIQAITSFTGKTYRKNAKYGDPEKNAEKGHNPRKPQWDGSRSAQRGHGPSLDVDPFELIQFKVACGERLTPEEQRLYNMVMSYMSGMY